MRNDSPSEENRAAIGQRRHVDWINSNTFFRESKLFNQLSGFIKVWVQIGIGIEIAIDNHRSHGIYGTDFDPDPDSDLDC